MSIIIGIDPGSKITGYGIISKKLNKLIYLDSGCIMIKVNDLSSKLSIIYENISRIINHFKPDCLAIERVFVSKNASSSLKLEQARVAAMIAAINLNLPIFEYATCKIKKIVTGEGFAKKKKYKKL